MKHVYYLSTVTFFRDLFSYNIQMFLHNVKEYDILQLIVCFIQTKAATPRTSFIYDTFFSISTIHIGKELPFICICQNGPIMLE